MLEKRGEGIKELFVGREKRGEDVEVSRVVKLVDKYFSESSS
jgi:hypothetical protein